MTPIEQDIKRIEHYSSSIALLLDIKDGKRLEWLQRYMAYAYQLGRADGRAEEFYRHYGHEKGETVNKG